MSLFEPGNALQAATAALIVVVLSAVSVTALGDDSADAGDLSAEEVAERVQHFYAETEDFQAAFVQEYTDIAAAETSQSRGRVYFKKPGMMRWDYYHADRDERDRMLVADGDYFWVYEYEYQQVFQQCLEESQLPTALRFMMGEGDLLEEFEVELADASTADNPVLELEPREPTADYRKLEFVLDGSSFEVARSTLYDPYGNTNEIQFHDARVNQNLSADGFEFEPPEGARLLNPEQQCD